MPVPIYDYLGWRYPDIKDIPKLIKLGPQSLLYSGKIAPLFKAKPGDSLSINWGGDVAIYNEFTPPFISFGPSVPGETILSVSASLIKVDIWPEGDSNEVNETLTSDDIEARRRWRDLTVEPDITFLPPLGVPGVAPGSMGIFMNGYFTERNWYDRELLIKNSPSTGQTNIAKDEFLKFTWKGSFRNNKNTDPDFSTPQKEAKFNNNFEAYTTWLFDQWHPETYQRAITIDASVIQGYLSNFGNLVKATPTEITALVYTTAITVIYQINGVIQFPAIYFGYTPVQYDWEYQKKRYEYIKGAERGKVY